MPDSVKTYGDSRVIQAVRKIEVSDNPERSDFLKRRIAELTKNGIRRGDAFSAAYTEWRQKHGEWI